VETSTPPPAAPAKADDATGFNRPADDRLTGAEQIGDFMGTTKRVAIWNMEAGRWPHWREGNRYVASKSQLSAFWREATAQTEPAKSPSNPRYRGSPYRRGGGRAA
jgi:hypothetical protein